MDKYELTAKSSIQLGICLKFLHAQKLRYAVRVEEISETKSVFRISVDADEETFKAVSETYRILIS